MKRLAAATLLVLGLTACGGGGSKGVDLGVPRCDDLVGKPANPAEWSQGCLIRPSGAKKDSIELVASYKCKDGTTLVQAADYAWGRTGQVAQRGTPPPEVQLACSTPAARPGAVTSSS